MSKFPHYQRKTVFHQFPVAEALACNAGGDGFVSHLQLYFLDLFHESTQSLTRRDVNGPCGKLIAGICCDL